MATMVRTERELLEDVEERILRAKRPGAQVGLVAARVIELIRKHDSEQPRLPPRRATVELQPAPDGIGYRATITEDDFEVSDVALAAPLGHEVVRDASEKGSIHIHPHWWREVLMCDCGSIWFREERQFAIPKGWKVERNARVRHHRTRLQVVCVDCGREVKGS